MIYVLLLEKDKWYIGYTDRKDGERFTEHFTGLGSEWTKKYKPVQVMEWKKGDLKDEDKVTLEYMQKYGWWNVRGGSYCKVEMTQPPKKLVPPLPVTITKPTASDRSSKCYRCGRTGHFESNCYAKTYVEESDDKCSEECSEDSEKCSRCGRFGHYTEDCYANKHIRGYFIKD